MPEGEHEAFLEHMAATAEDDDRNDQSDIDADDLEEELRYQRELRISM